MTQVMGSNQELREGTEVGGVDRISNLPDDILIHILSFLPTKYAVLTTVLSTKWKSKWMNINNIDFDYDHFFGDREFKNDASLARFLDFIAYVLLFCESLNFDKFRLSCHKHINLSCLHKCILYAVSRNVRVLELDVTIGFYYELPQLFFLSESLQVLRFRTEYIFHVPEFECFPNLKLLELSFSSSYSFVFDNKICYRFKKLESMIITVTPYKSDVIILKVFAPSLQNLKIQFPYDSSSNLSFELEVEAPELEYLYIKDYSNACTLKGCFPHLNRAVFDVGSRRLRQGPMGRDFTREVVSKGVDARILFLSLNTTTTLSKIILPPPCFPNLICLDITTFDYNVRHVLSYLLIATPCLQRLTLKVNKNEEPAKIFSIPLNWSSCVRTTANICQHLEVINIRSFSGLFVERNVIKFLLEHAKVLRKMSIDVVEPNSKDNFSREY